MKIDDRDAPSMRVIYAGALAIVLLGAAIGLAWALASLAAQGAAL